VYDEGSVLLSAGQKRTQVVDVGAPERKCLRDHP